MASLSRLLWTLQLAAASGAQYLRLASLSPSSWAVQTAVVQCSLRDRTTGACFSVDLVSTVHLARPEYYSALQSVCDERYDRVCFEMIADDNCFSTDANVRIATAPSLTPPRPSPTPPRPSLLPGRAAASDASPGERPATQPRRAVRARSTGRRTRLHTAAVCARRCINISAAGYCAWPGNSHIASKLFSAADLDI